ncbi:ATP-binding protein [Niallia sp. Krafla_26]|uniref:ATP-binding protein n=1 Tax=Niallia sp. Krafla_26 TaxID=3064703 RepID=UPI003D17D274
MKLDLHVHEERENDTHLSQLASVGQIAAGIAHEVKNPLTAVKGFLQLLEQEEKHEYIGIAQAELDNALITLNNLLQVSKPDSEHEEYQTINLAVELESILNLFQDQMYNVKVLTDFNDTDTTITGKKNLYKKAFFNLIKNAFESMNGVGTLSVSHKKQGQHIVVTIKDTGVGIPPEKLSQLGTPFFTTKNTGTGLGLTQVYSTIYQHGGEIFVNSKEGQGTVFTIEIPVKKQLIKQGVRELNLEYEDNYSIKDFLLRNRCIFEENLLEEATNVRDKIEDIHKVGNINLLKNAHKLVLLVVEEREHELISFAKEEGVAWSKHSLSVAFKLEWIQAIRRTLWDFLYNFDKLNQSEVDRVIFYSMEKRINKLIDQFMSYFFISYSRYKDELLEQQRKMVEQLSVPIIPINSETNILPLTGEIDEIRIVTMQDKILIAIENSQIKTLIIDLSGIAPMGKEIVRKFNEIIEGIAMMGCKTIITGLRAEIVKDFINSGIGINGLPEYKGNLQQALQESM